MQAVVASLKRDIIKCQTLLTSQLSPEDLVRNILKSLHPASSHQEPSSSSSNGVDDIGQVCNSQHFLSSPPIPITALADPTAEVKKSQRTADHVNCVSLTSSTLQPDSAVHKPRKFDLLLPSEFEDSFKRHDISSHGCRHKLIARCEAKDQELVAQRSSAREFLTAQTNNHPTKEVTNPGETHAKARSVSSDGPPPEESQFKRILRSLLPY